MTTSSTLPKTSITTLFRVGPAQSKRLATLGIRTIRDLLFHMPFRYEDLRHVRTIASCKPGERVYIKGHIVSIGSARLRDRGRRSLTEAIVSDDTGSMKLVWFHQPYLAQSLKKDIPIALCGKVQMNKFGLHMPSPDYEIIRGEQIHTGRIVPVYPTTAGISTKWIRSLIKQELNSVGRFSDILPQEIKEKYDLADLDQSLQHIHFPESIDDIARAKRRLAFDELFFTQLGVKLRKEKMKSLASTPLKIDHAIVDKFISTLPFSLTRGQQKVIGEITADLGRPHPMNRILEGDVGSGKTVVAIAAMLGTVTAGKHAFLMAPTEILALQHYERIYESLIKFHIRVGLLTHGYQRIQNRAVTAEKIEQEIKKQSIDILIGTHALLFSVNTFKDLGLVVVDEQHRFGVKQRNELQKKSARLPHFLSMTATPIPRTLALTIYGDLDISILDETPAHKKTIITKIVKKADRAGAYKFIDRQIISGRQVFVVCPLIDESDLLGVTSVKEEYERLRKTIFPHRKIAMLHGKMKSQEKQQAISKFEKGAVDILVSTSVIEVGIDIPNATIMMIEGAERFGLAQLHQFRGRVGRGSEQSYCLLFSESYSPNTKARLQALEKSANGFELAQIDLELRGHGELYGIKQSGLPDFRLANLSDQKFVALTHEAALFAAERLDQWPALQKIAEKFQKEVHLE